MATIMRRGGAYQVKVRHKGVRQSMTFRTKARAEEWARKIESDVDANRVPRQVP